jgi:glycosyltransferase involved in cell wall biosynthesis
MKILYHHRFAAKDGQFLLVEALTSALGALGHDVRIVAPGAFRSRPFGSGGGVVRGMKRALPRGAYEVLELGYGLVVGLRLAHAIQTHDPDVIYERANLHQPVGVILAKLHGIPILLEVNAPMAQERKTWAGLAFPALARRIEGFTWRRADKVLPVSRVLADIVREEGVPGERIEVIPNGIDVHLRDSLRRRPERPPGEELVIGFTGFLHRWHRLDLAIEALAHLVRARLVIVGDGEERRELEALARARGLSHRVAFLGLRPRQDLARTLSRFDIAIQPATTPYASPLKLFEYMAAGALIVAPKTPNILEILDDGCALLFDPVDPDGFSQCLQRAVRDFDELTALRQSAVARIDERGFTWQHNARRVAALMEQLVIGAKA